MALAHLLYRCPLCGHDPTTGTGDQAACPGCGARFSWRGGYVRVEDGAGPRETTPAALLDAIRARGGAVGSATAPNGRVRHEAPARFHGYIDEAPVWRGGRLLGFRERPAPGRDGVLVVDEATLAFRPGRGEGGSVSWALLELTALQVASRSLQIGVRGRGTAQLTLRSDSALRWEELLRALLRRAWRGEGRGEILEFQPRITAR